MASSSILCLISLVLKVKYVWGGRQSLIFSCVTQGTLYIEGRADTGRGRQASQVLTASSRAARSSSGAADVMQGHHWGDSSWEDVM